MKKLAVRSRLRALGIVLALGLTLAALTSPAKAVGGWSGCGEPYERVVPHCTLWGWYCWDTTEACADCDQGTACFQE
jgi:hypothetical protein